MSNHRPYRPALTTEDVIAGLYKNKGKKYDSRVVDIFISLLVDKKLQNII